MNARGSGEPAFTTLGILGGITMGKRLLPTTKVQVSGHRFMRRRVEHGLIFGDVRMIHDPLASRRRATAFGTISVLLISGVMGLYAWMRPNPDPGDAPILRAADGELYVRVDDMVHPVTCLLYTSPSPRDS